MKKLILSSINEHTGLTAFIFAMLAGVITTLFLLTFAGCDNTQPLSLLLQDSTKPTSEIVGEIADCYKGVDTDTVNKEYAFVLDKDCLDSVLLGKHYTDTAIAEMVSRDDFRLEGKTIKLTGTVVRRFEESGNLILNPQDTTVDIWISPPWISAGKKFDAEKTLQYTVGETYTFDVLVWYIDREGDPFEVPQYQVWCNLIV